MPLKFTGYGHPHELPDDAADELIRRLKRDGLIQRDLGTGEVVVRFADGAARGEPRGSSRRPGRP